MSEHRPEFASEQPAEEPEATDSSGPDGAVPATAVGVLDGSDDEGALFTAELVRAMQTTARIERIKIGEESERRRQAHIERVRARQAAEVDGMRELASDDMRAIETWAAGETRRIKLERERRAKDLNEDLDLSLAEHGSKIDQEIEGIETAIATYLADVDAFFDDLDRETDVVLIARQAARRPVFPALDAVVRSDAVASSDQPAAEVSPEETPRAEGDDAAADVGATGATDSDAATEPAVVGVMDPAAEAIPVESWVAPPEPTPEAAEPVTAASASSHSGASSLFQSVSVLRPMSWLRRDANGGDHSDRES